MGAREQPPSKRRRIGVVWDEGNLAKHSAERGTPDPASEEQVFFADVSLAGSFTPNPPDKQNDRHIYMWSEPRLRFLL